jgi:drug/metabolite transporter (DMT)-like permease|tara:strand:+ start:121 stop:963 length:843 start_codon:yes stop_codon:yes gene_type:complete
MPEYMLFFILLIAALSHAICHSLLKHNDNPLGLLGITSLVEIIIFTPLIFFVPFPTSHIWLLIISSALLHGLYRMLVLYSYKFGDLSFVYPVARGGSSLLLAVISIIYLSDKISLFGFLAILVICFGLFLISYSKKNKFNKIAFILGVLTALMITSYTLVDGMGIRHSKNPYTYLYWMLLLNGTPALLASLMFKGTGLRKINKDLLIKGISFGILAPLAYGLVVWCMQYLPIAYASAIRETSIIFATLIGLLILKEKDANSRIIPAIFIVIGIGILYFQI